MSDIAGQDIQSHNNAPEEIVKVVRNWLRTASRHRRIPSGDIIWERYQNFMQDLPEMTEIWQLDANNLIYNDYIWLIVKWLRTRENRLSQRVQGGN